MNETLLKQIKKVRDEILTQSQGYVVGANETIVDSFSHFLIWDDEHGILFAITNNVELDTQGGLPYRIKMINYSYIERMWSLYGDNPEYNKIEQGRN